MSLYTYCQGPKYRCKYRLDQWDFARVLSELVEVFGKNYQFQLTESGIEILNWPGKKTGMMKIFCLKFTDNLTFETELIAMHGARCWTLKELEKWNKVWTHVGVSVDICSLYPTSKYISCGDLGKEATGMEPPKKRFRVHSTTTNRLKKVKIRLI